MIVIEKESVDFNQELVEKYDTTRFGAMFKNADFKVDKTSAEYGLVHPSERVKALGHKGAKRGAFFADVDPIDSKKDLISRQARI